MSLIYITGVEGAGKSVVCKALKSQGYDALGIDEAGLARRYYKHTWKLTNSLPAPLESSYEWYNEREWKIKSSDVLRIKQHSGTNPIFLCGITDNFKEIKDLVDKTFCLTLPENVVIQRIQARKNDTFGKNEAQLEYILKKHRLYEDDNQRAGSIMVDASMPLARVVDVILHDAGLTKS